MTDIDIFARLRRLADNWDGHGSPAPTAACIAEAERHYHMMVHLGKTPDYVVPTADGGVGMTWRRGDMYMSVELRNDGETIGLEQRDSEAPIIAERQSWSS